MGKPMHWGSVQIGCLSSPLLFNYTAQNHRGYIRASLILREAISAAPFIMQSADKSGTAEI